jgi:hypothetical protein
MGLIRWDLRFAVEDRRQLRRKQWYDSVVSGARYPQTPQLPRTDARIAVGEPRPMRTIRSWRPAASSASIPPLYGAPRFPMGPPSMSARPSSHSHSDTTEEDEQPNDPNLHAMIREFMDHRQRALSLRSFISPPADASGHASSAPDRHVQAIMQFLNNDDDQST